MFKVVCLSLFTAATALHNGFLQWLDILHGTYDEFSLKHDGLNILLQSDERPDTLRALQWTPVCQFPERVFDHPESSYSRSIPGCLGQTSKHIQNW